MYGSQCLAGDIMLLCKYQSVVSKLIIQFQEWKYPETVIKNSLYNNIQLEEQPIKALQAFPLRVEIHVRLRIVIFKIFFHLLVQILHWQEWHEALKWVRDFMLAVEYGREGSNLTQSCMDQELPLPGCSVTAELENTLFVFLKLLEFACISLHTLSFPKQPGQHAAKAAMQWCAPDGMMRYYLCLRL